MNSYLVDEADHDLNVLEPQASLDRDELARGKRHLDHRARLRQTTNGRNADHQPAALSSDFDVVGLHAASIAPPHRAAS